MCFGALLLRFAESDYRDILDGIFFIIGDEFAFFDVSDTNTVYTLSASKFEAVCCDIAKK